MATVYLLIILTTFVAAPTIASGQQASMKELKLFRLLNQLRAVGFTCPNGHNFPPNPIPLKFDCRLWRASQLHSQDMADQNYFSRISKDGRNFVVRGQAQGIIANAENIAAGRAAAQRVLDHWKASDRDCQKMLNSASKLFGAGYGFNISSTNGHYWTQMFKNTTIAVDKSCLVARGTDSSTNSSTETSSTTIITNAATTMFTAPAVTTTARTYTTVMETTSITVVSQVQGSLVLNVSNSSFCSGDVPSIETQTRLAAAIANMAGVSIRAVVVVLAEPHRLRLDVLTLGTLTVEFAITLPTNEAPAVVRRISSTELSLATRAVIQRLSDAEFDGLVEVLEFSAHIVANDEGVADVKDEFVQLIVKLICAAIGAIIGLLVLLCCCCYCQRHYYMNGTQEEQNNNNGIAEMQDTTSKVVLPVLLNMEEGNEAKRPNHPAA